MNTENRTYIPAAFGKKPETPQEALLSAVALLEEEGRWGQQEWFYHHNALMEEYKDNPYCNSWVACADGALQIVTIGLFKNTNNRRWYPLMDHAYLHPNDRDESVSSERLMYCEARDLLNHILQDDSVENFNDSNTREEVIALLREAAQ